MPQENIIKQKSFDFALRIIALNKQLTGHKEYVISRQIMRSGTAVGALIREAEHAESKADFIHKNAISLKEANETIYWLELLHRSEYISNELFSSLYTDAEEILKILIAIIKTSKKNR